MLYYTHCKHKGAHHYVCVDVLAGFSFHCMPYYTYYRYKGAHHYVSVDVLSDCSYDCMPYNTLHINIDAHPYVYHRNICIQHCVHAVVHSEYPGKNTKVKR